MCYRKYTLTFSYRTGCCCEILMEISFSRQIFENISLKIFEWGPTVGQTDTHTYIHEDVIRDFTKTNKIRNVNWGSEWGKVLHFNMFKPAVTVYSKWMNSTEVQTDKITIKYYRGKIPQL
jgi:hypothetical protein